jgi:hypothetical protein
VSKRSAFPAPNVRIELCLLASWCGVIAAVSCSDPKAPDPGPRSDAGVAGNVVVAGAGNEGGGTSAVEAGAPPVESAGDGAGGESATPSMTLSVYNVVLNLAVPGHDPTAGQLERVELPAWITLRANVPDGTRSVEFTTDDVVTVDDFTPFLMDNDGFGTAHWQPTTGEHVVRARAFSKEGRQGSLLASVEQTILYRETGLQPDFEPLSETANLGWVEQNLDQVMEAREHTSALGTLPYRLFVPPEYDAAVQYPLLVFLHDRDARGADNRSATYASSLFTGTQSLVSPNVRHQFPAIIVVPQCPAEPADHEWGRWYGSTPQDPRAGLVFEDGHYPSHDEPSLAASLVRELIDEVAQQYSIDPQRRYITGESMGGLGTGDITWRWPELWAVAVPIAGWTDTARAPQLLDIPFWVFHSAADTEDNVIGSLNMVDKLKLLGGIVYYTQYQDVAHAETAARVWTSEPTLLPWIWGHVGSDLK